MTILLLGKNGQVGRELSRSLLPLGNLISLGQAELDLKNHRELAAVLERFKPRTIVNASAYTAVDKAEQDQDAAWAINATAVAVMAKYAKKHQALLVHYSTDYVFNGKKTSAYQETDSPDPLNVYGASKLAGEQAILTSGCRNLVFRTSWVFSAHGHNFIKTILNLACHKDQLTVVDDQRGAPTSAEFIADVTAHALMAYSWERLPSGLYHLTANGVISWYDLACYLIDKTRKYGLDFKLDFSEIKPVSSASYPLPAERPKNSVLDTTCLSSQLNMIFPGWSTYVDRMIQQLIHMRFFERV